MRADARLEILEHGTRQRVDAPRLQIAARRGARGALENVAHRRKRHRGRQERPATEPGRDGITNIHEGVSLATARNVPGLRGRVSVAWAERKRNPGAASPHLERRPRVSLALNPGYEATTYFVSVIAVYGPCGTMSMLCTLLISLVAGFDSALRTTSPNSGSSARAARRLSRSAFEG